MEMSFDLFVHHYTHTPKDLQTLYLGVILHNPGKPAITVDVLQDAPVTLSPYWWENVQVDLIYPPDSTPPHALNVKTLENSRVLSELKTQIFTYRCKKRQFLSL